MKWVRATPVSMVDLCFSPPSWHWWAKLFDIEWNWSLFPIIFLNNLPKVLRRTIEWKYLEVSYDNLFSLGIITIVDVLKWLGQ